MAVPFTRTDFLTEISDKELTALTTKVANVGDPDPVATAIASSRSIIADYAERFDLRPDTEKRLIRELGVALMCRRLEDVPERYQKAYDAAIKFLEGIRDRKFADLPQKDPIPDDVASYEGRFGSKRRVGTIHD